MDFVSCYLYININTLIYMYIAKHVINFIEKMGFSVGQMRPQNNPHQGMQGGIDMQSNNMNLMMNPNNNNNNNLMLGNNNRGQGLPGMDMDIHFPNTMGMNSGIPGIGEDF